MSMRPVRLISLYFAFVFVGGALLAPWIYQLIRVTSVVFPSLLALASKPFPRYVNRSLLIMALAGLYPFLRAANLCSWRALGLQRRPRALHDLGFGFALGLGSLACLVFIALAAGARRLVPDFGTSDLTRHLFRAGLTAGCVAPLEEIVFRGTLFGTLRRTFHWAVALVFSSAIFALLHFLERPGPVDQIRWWSGMRVLGEMLLGFRDLEKLFPGFLNLTLVGMILGLTYQRTGMLHFSIGLHAGWIFWLKTYWFITMDGPVRQIWLFGTSKLIDGWLAFGILGVAFVLLSTFMAQRAPTPSYKERTLLC